MDAYCTRASINPDILCNCTRTVRTKLNLCIARPTQLHNYATLFKLIIITLNKRLLSKYPPLYSYYVFHRVHVCSVFFTFSHFDKFHYSVYKTVSNSHCTRIHYTSLIKIQSALLQK